MRYPKQLIGFVLLITGAQSALARSAGAPEAFSGAPGDGVCTQCHRSNPLNTGMGSLTISFSNGTTYTPGQQQRVTVTLNRPDARRWGFQVSPRVASDAGGTGAGTLAPLGDGNTQLAPSRGSLQWITHTTQGNRNGAAGPQSYEFDWTAPATNVGDVEFYVAGNAADASLNNQGDFVYAIKATLSPSVTPAARPAIRENGVAGSATSAAGVAPGSFFTIVGEKLSLITREWRGGDFVDGNLPTTLDGVRVSVNGKPASILYISPGLINAQAPDDTATGNVPVVVTAPAGESQSRTIMLQQFAPAFYLWPVQGNRFVAATLANGNLLGPAGLLGSALTTRPARPGEVIVLYGTGFGPANPAVPAGRLFSGAARLTNEVRITIGGMQAEVSFAGISASGLYQFNLTVPPNVPDGDQAVVATVAGQQSPAGAFLAVAR